MTVEEKAPYLDRANKYWYQNTVIIGFYSRENELEVKNAYIDGLAEGRKERNCVDCSNHGKQFEVMKLEKENEELKKMFEFICKQRFGYAWNMNKDVYIADIKKALKGEKTQWV